MFYEKIAKAKGWGVNPNKDCVNTVAEGLLHNKEVHGAMYCPCLIKKTPETMCPCKAWREGTDHICHCGLYTRPQQ